jgi:hypothetical protein
MELELWVPQGAETVVKPATGESLDLTVAEWPDLARIRAGIVEIGHRMDELARMLDSEMARRLDRDNERSLTVGGYQLRVNAPLRDAWDVPALMRVLTELVNDGILAKGAAQRAIKSEVSHKPVAVEVKKLLTHDDPRVRERIAECHTTVNAKRTVSVTGGPDVHN